MDFNKYDDASLVKKYEGFIDRDGYFYKVCPRGSNKLKDNHNNWAEKFIREKLCIKDFKFNPTASALLTLSTLGGPAEILIECFGYVYYSHDPDYFKPIIKLPNPKIANNKATEEQLDFLFEIMLMNNENTDIPIFLEENKYVYYGQEEDIKKL